MASHNQGAARQLHPLVTGAHNEALHVLLAVVCYCAAWQVYSLDVDTFKWSEHTPDVSGDPPSPRDCHSAVALPDGRHILVFGGGDSDAEVFFSSVALLDTQTWRWSSPKLQVGHRDLASLTCGTFHAEGALLGPQAASSCRWGAVNSGCKNCQTAASCWSHKCMGVETAMQAALSAGQPCWAPRPTTEQLPSW